MPDDIFDTRYEDKEVEIDDGFVTVGDDVNLLEKDPSLHKIKIGMGWEINTFDGEAVDMDVSLFLLDKNDETRVDEDFVFYNNMMALDGAVKLHGDSRTGAGEGDDETVSVDFHGVPFDVVRIVIFISIYQGLEKEQTLALVRSTYMRIVNEENGMELCRFDISKLVADREETGMVIGYIEREGPKWHFRPQAEFHEDGLYSYGKSKGLVIIQQ